MFSPHQKKQADAQHQNNAGHDGRHTKQRLPPRQLLPGGLGQSLLLSPGFGLRLRFGRLLSLTAGRLLGLPSCLLLCLQPGPTGGVGLYMLKEVAAHLVGAHRGVVQAVAAGGIAPDVRRPGDGAVLGAVDPLVEPGPVLALVAGEAVLGNLEGGPAPQAVQRGVQVQGDRVFLLQVEVEQIGRAHV